MARHSHLTGGYGNGSREDCPTCQQARQLAADASAARIAAICNRVELMRLRYVTPMADGSRITDDETFAVDIIADVLVYAGSRMGDDWNDINDAVETALRHARHELNDHEETLHIEEPTPDPR